VPDSVFQDGRECFQAKELTSDGPAEVPRADAGDMLRGCPEIDGEDSLWGGGGKIPLVYTRWLRGGVAYGGPRGRHKGRRGQQGGSSERPEEIGRDTTTVALLKSAHQPSLRRQHLSRKKKEKGNCKFQNPGRREVADEGTPEVRRTDNTAETGEAKGWRESLR